MQNSERNGTVPLLTKKHVPRPEHRAILCSTRFDWISNVCIRLPPSAFRCQHRSQGIGGRDGTATGDQRQVRGKTAVWAGTLSAVMHEPRSTHSVEAEEDGILPRSRKHLQSAVEWKADNTSECARVCMCVCSVVSYECVHTDISMLFPKNVSLTMMHASAKAGLLQN